MMMMMMMKKMMLMTDDDATGEKVPCGPKHKYMTIIKNLLYLNTLQLILQGTDAFTH